MCAFSSTWLHSAVFQAHNHMNTWIYQNYRVSGSLIFYLLCLYWLLNFFHLRSKQAGFYDCSCIYRVSVVEHSLIACCCYCLGSFFCMNLLRGYIVLFFWAFNIAKSECIGYTSQTLTCLPSSYPCTPPPAGRAPFMPPICCWLGPFSALAFRVGADTEMVNKSIGCCANLINIPRFTLFIQFCCSARIPCTMLASSGVTETCE